MDSVALDQMLELELARRVDRSGIDDFLAGDGLRVLFFSGLGGKRAEGHDAAVALRELLREYGGSVRAGVIAFDDERFLMGRFRVAVLPSIVFVSGGESLEVLPRVRDWAEYAAAFQRYLGSPGAAGRANGSGAMTA